MSDFDLNLSTQRFPAYRRLNLALVFILAILIGVSVWQTVGFVRYSKMASAIRAQEQELRVEGEVLGKRVAELESRLDRPESTAKLNEIGFLNHLILRKNLSWTRLFAVLEAMVPDNVHLVNLAPNIGADGGITLNLSVRARSIADVKEFLQRVEKSPLFGKLDVTAKEKKDEVATTDVEVILSAVYYPERDTR
jgi:Tfp pilus assembly protein PilN